MSLNRQVEPTQPNIRRQAEGQIGQLDHLRLQLITEPHRKATTERKGRSGSASSGGINRAMKRASSNFFAAVAESGAGAAAAAAAAVAAVAAVAEVGSSSSEARPACHSLPSSTSHPRRRQCASLSWCRFRSAASTGCCYIRVRVAAVQEQQRWLLWKPVESSLNLALVAS